MSGSVGRTEPNCEPCDPNRVFGSLVSSPDIGSAKRECFVELVSKKTRGGSPARHVKFLEGEEGPIDRRVEIAARGRAHEPPRITAARCVAVTIAGARCAACVDACPRAALELGISADRRARVLHLDATLCDGCDLCFPACPTNALARASEPSGLRAGPDLFLACDALPPDDEVAATARIACVDAIAMADLASWRRSGVARLLTPRVECERCARGPARLDEERGPARRLETTVADHDTLARSRGLPSLCLETLAPAEWTERARAATRAVGEPEPARRAFLRRILTVVDATTSTEQEPRCAFGVSLAPSGRPMVETALAAVAPTIDTARCDGCDACLRLCPAQVFDRVDGGIRVTPTACTGCGVCRDVCDREAVTLAAPAGAVPRLFEQEIVACRECGHAFARETAAATSLCRVCATPVRSDRRNRIVFTPDVIEERST